MQIKTIKKNVENKLTEWLNSITDTNLSTALKSEVLCSGGSIASMLLKVQVNDYDIYIKDRGVLLSLVKYYCKPYLADAIKILDGAKKIDLLNEIEKEYHGLPFDQIKSAYASSLRNLKEDQIKLFCNNKQGGFKIEYPEVKEGSEPLKKYRPLFFSPNAITLSDQIQIVIRFHGDDIAIHKTFDFIHPTNYFTFEKGLVTNVAALESLITMQLKYQGSLYPVTSIIRVRKFIKRGWNIGAGELLKIMFQISQLNLNDPDVLEEQLIGVDIAYFAVLIEALREMYDRNPKTVLTPEYLNALIDKIFNESEAEEGFAI